jgi:aquaporin Z
MKSNSLRKYSLECLGTIFFLYVILLTGQAWAIGLALALMIYIVGPVTGGHFNPAVSIMMYAKKQISMNDTLLYILSQVLGGLIALGLYKMLS